MSRATCADMLELARTLSRNDRLRLIADLALTARDARTEVDEGNSWFDLEGTLPYPALGEDAQAWVSRSRQESDRERTGPPVMRHRDHTIGT